MLTQDFLKLNFDEQLNFLKKESLVEKSVFAEASIKSTRVILEARKRFDGLKDFLNKDVKEKIEKIIIQSENEAHLRKSVLGI